MNEYRKECGSCEHWMKKSQCPRENGPGKGPSMSSPPCNHFLLEWSQASKMVAPAVPPVRFRHDPIIKWGEIKQTPRDHGHIFMELEGRCPNGRKISISSHWDGWRYSSVSVYPTHFTPNYCYAETFEQAKAMMESHAREWYQNEFDKAVRKLENAMYCLGLDHPLSIHQRLK